MKVLLVANIFPPVIGGSATVYAQLCRQLGPDVTVVAPWRSYKDGQLIQGWEACDAGANYSVHRVELLRPFFRTSAGIPILGSGWRLLFNDLPLERRVRDQVLRVVESEKPDVVCLGEVFMLYSLGRALRKICGLPVIQFIHGEEITISLDGSARYRSHIKAALREYEGIVAVSRFTRDRLVAMGTAAEKVHLVPNGVDLDTFQPGPPSLALVSRYGLAGRKVLLTVGRLEPKKGFDMVLRSLPRILERIPDLIYLIVGTGEHLAWLRDIANQAGVAANVVFAGEVAATELADYYRTCDVFIMPNRTLEDGNTEGFGLVFLEAGACGKPVIGGKAGGVPDAVHDGQTGILVNGTSEDQIAAAVIRILSDPQLSAAFATAGLEHARRSSWKSRAELFKYACEKTIARGRPRPV